MTTSVEINPDRVDSPGMKRFKKIVFYLTGIFGISALSYSIYNPDYWIGYFYFLYSILLMAGLRPISEWFQKYRCYIHLSNQQLILKERGKRSVIINTSDLKNLTVSNGHLIVTKTDGTEYDYSLTGQNFSFQLIQTVNREIEDLKSNLNI